MPGTVCPILSAGTGPQKDCIGGQCMMFQESNNGGACSFVKSPAALASRLDTVSAQLSEMQVALIKLTNA